MLNHADYAFVALGDIHLSDYIWRDLPDIRGDAELGLRNLVDQAIRLNVPAVIVGDLYDRAEQRDAGSIRIFDTQMARLKAAGLPCYAIQGNHDKRSIPWYALNPHVRHIGDGQPVEINGVACRGLDYALHDTIRERLGNLGLDGELPEVLFLHQAVRQALKFDGAWNCDLEWVPEGIPLVVMGDIHREWEMTFRPGQRALYTGSGCPRNRDEFGPRTILGVRRNLEWDRLPVPTRAMRHLVWSSEAPGEVAQWVATNRAVIHEDLTLAPLLKVTCLDSQAQEIHQALREFTGLHLDIEQVPDLKALKALELSLPDLPSRSELLGRVIQGPGRDTARRLAQELLETQGSQADVLLAHRTQFYARSGR